MAKSKLASALDKKVRTTSTDKEREPYFGTTFNLEDSEKIVQAYNKATGEKVTIEMYGVPSAIALYVIAKFVQSQGIEF